MTVATSLAAPIVSRLMEVERPLLVADGVSKTFPGVIALDEVSFEVRAGEVNALVGENGAGKSTLIKLMAGYYAPDSGVIRVNGIVLEADPATAHRAGVATIHQDHHLVPSMTVAENIMLGHWPSRYGVISKREQLEHASRVIAQVAPDLSPEMLARRLSPAEGQLVEIARALSEDSQVLIMDEPTTSLSGKEIDQLFRVVDELKAKGLGIVFVSHWLEEVFRIADRVTVLRDGRLVGSEPASELDTDKVIHMMVGRGVDTVTTKSQAAGDIVLEVRNLNRIGVLDDVSLVVRAGEIVTLAGLVGAGRTELVNCIFGVDRYDSGEVLLENRPLPPGDPNAAIEAGIGLAPEDRRHQALIGNLSVMTNATLAVLKRIAPRGIISKERERAAFDKATRSVAVKMSSPNAPVSTLSGGNQQKVVLGRWLARNPKLLILDEPTKGIDVGAKVEISEIIVQLAAEGTAILIVSSEMPEVIALSDRVIVMRSGHVAGELGREAITPEAVMNLATTG
ncbi:MAG: sugar ABC transporter ATP-binding protein [Bauldia sp.]|nr:sugar ABC transporter ATP-binding protein [Bauldia sp.]